MIKLVEVSKSFGKRTVIDRLTLDIKEGSLFAITGESGSGKSTLLNIIGLIDTEYSGELWIQNRCMKQLKQSEIRRFIRNNVSYLFQNYALVDDASVRYNLRLVAKEKNNNFEQALHRVGLSGDILDTPVYILSGGEQQRVALCRAILKQSPLILADEPTGNLDDNNADIVIHILRELASEGKTVIVVTHSDRITEHCDGIYSIEKDKFISKYRESE